MNDENDNGNDDEINFHGLLPLEDITPPKTTTIERPRRKATNATFKSSSNTTMPTTIQLKMVTARAAHQRG